MTGFSVLQQSIHSETNDCIRKISSDVEYIGLANPAS